MPDLLTPALIAAAVGAGMTLVFLAVAWWLGGREQHWTDDDDFHDGSSAERHGTEPPRRPGPGPDGEVYFTDRQTEPLKVVRGAERKNGGGA